MTVAEILQSRISTRAFLDKPVSEHQVREILDIARWSPSGGNLQPWRVHVVTGTARERLVETVKKAIAENPMADESEIHVYPPKLSEPWRTRRYELGEAMYDLLDIPRENKMGRLMQLAKNYEFFGAPVGLFFSLNRQFDKGQWAHLGMLMQSIALVAEEKGLSTCMQEAWAMRARTVTEFLGLSDDEQLYCGMALGYGDKAAKVNDLRSSRVTVDDFATFITE
ncbi:nitroreductase [Hyphococcus flavus]|uniref:Nitroreductase n=1 Tax=Hyphococcus flavus TaxID=1866326 RepID=A0AAF0CE37_9PROT|nr:nitroreductase [Hyphococcus flavus]WDI30626.1 nitroreductase [Hyphococcus flavus]